MSLHLAKALHMLQCEFQLDQLDLMVTCMAVISPSIISMSCTAHLMPDCNGTAKASLNIAEA